ncbi:MAG: amidohydrolase family protein [Synergistaceae bacterium]|nr:amidohydrolase family protein [Synergistaceae bacterium]
MRISGIFEDEEGNARYLIERESGGAKTRMIYDEENGRMDSVGPEEARRMFEDGEFEPCSLPASEMFFPDELERLASFFAPEYGGCGMKTKKIVLYNGKIAVPGGFASGIAVDGQTILSVGSSEDVLADCGAAEKIDLGGRLVLPGFNDGHMHFLAYALSLEQGDFTGSSSLAEVRSRFRSFLDRTKPEKGEWIVGRGWNH